MVERNEGQGRRQQLGTVVTKGWLSKKIRWDKGDYDLRVRGNHGV